MHEDERIENGHHDVIDRAGEHLGFGGRHDLDAERSIAGAILLAGRATVDQLRAAGLEPAQVLDPTSRAVIGAAYDLAERHEHDAAIDVITIADELGDATSALQAPGTDGATSHGKHALVALQATCTSTSGAAHHARIVIGHAAQRAIAYALVDAAEAHRLGDQHRLDTALEQARAARVDTATTGASSWHAVDLAGILNGDEPAQPPTLLRRTDGAALVYAGKVNAFNAESETAKSWLALWACAQEIDEGRDAVYIDFEDTAHTAVERLLGFNLDHDQIAEHFWYLRPDDPFDIAGQAAVEQLLERTGASIVVIDGVTEAMHLHGLSLLDNDDIARFYSLLPRRIANHGPGVIDIDHVPKDVTNRKGGIGGQHKRAGVDGAILLLEPSRPFGRGLHGAARIVVDKDRPGHVRAVSHEGKIAGELHLDATSGQPNLYVEPVGGTAHEGPAWDGPTQCMNAVEHWFRTNPADEVSGRQMPVKLRAAGVSYRDRTVVEALERLASNGILDARKGPRNADLYRLATNTERDRGIF